MRIHSLLQKARYAVAGALFTLTIVSAGAASIAQPGVASADACDQVNIVYCGLNGSNLSGYVNSFQALYANGSNNGHDDLKAVYRWAGATDAMVAGMNTSNTKLGTMYRNGDIKVNGALVGTDAWVSARFGAGQNGFTHVGGDVWARKTTTSLAENTAPVIVHFDAAGNADFAVMVGCANAVKFTPKIQPKPVLDCVNLVGSEVGATRKFNFKAAASAKNTTISKYVFSYGDGSSDTVKTSGQNANASHTYGKDNTAYTARVTVYGSDFSGGKTSNNCTSTVKTPAPKPALACDNLTSANTAQALTYIFTANAIVSNTTIQNYVFTISDGKTTTTKTVTTSAASASLTYTFPSANTAYTIKATVNGKDVQNITSSACAVSLTTLGPKECKPGVPEGDQRCTECLPGIPQGSPECLPTTPTTPTPPSQLVNTGPGSTIAAFVAITTIGTVAHRYFARRKLGY